MAIASIQSTGRAGACEKDRSGRERLSQPRLDGIIRHLRCFYQGQWTVQTERFFTFSCGIGEELPQSRLTPSQLPQRGSLFILQCVHRPHRGLRQATDAAQRKSPLPVAGRAIGIHALPSGIGAITFLYSRRNRMSVVISEATSAMGKDSHTSQSTPVFRPMRASM